MAAVPIGWAAGRRIWGVGAAGVPQHSCLSLPLEQVSGDLVLCTLISRRIQPSGEPAVLCLGLLGHGEVGSG